MSESNNELYFSVRIVCVLVFNVSRADLFCIDFALSDSSEDVNSSLCAVNSSISLSSAIILSRTSISILLGSTLSKSLFFSSVSVDKVDSISLTNASFSGIPLSLFAISDFNSSICSNSALYVLSGDSGSSEAFGSIRLSGASA